MKETRVKRKNFKGEEVEIHGGVYEEGLPTQPDNWIRKLRNREEMLRYIRTAERYWYSEDWFGSEKRKTKA